MGWNYFSIYLNNLVNLTLSSIPYLVRCLIVNIILGIITGIVIFLIRFVKKKIKVKFLSFILIFILLSFEIVSIFFFYNLYGAYSLIAALIVVTFVIADNM